MDVSLFSARYAVRRLNQTDIPDIFALCRENTLFYQHCPPFVTAQKIMDDMKALPPGKEMDDKHYVGYFDAGRLIAVMDLIMAYPDEHTAFIGFFMTEVSIQNVGIGSNIISELCHYLSDIGIARVRLGWVRGNPQSEHFWHKNGFTETGFTYDTTGYTVIVAQRLLREAGSIHGSE